MGVRYANRDEVKSALDSKDSARNNRQIDRAIEAASRSVEQLTHRKFYPQMGTFYFDYPSDYTREVYRLWLEESELISVTQILSGSVEITSDQYYLEPSSSGPPFTHLDLRLDKTGSFGNGATRQRDIAITGVVGYCNDLFPVEATLTADLDASQTDVDVSNSVYLGVGDLLSVDSEKMLITNKQYSDTSVNTANSFTSSMSDVTLTLSTTTNAPVEDEIIQIDSERMLVISVSGTSVIVKRAYDGTVLASHSSGTDIYAPRNFTVERSVVGTVAATHTSGTALYKNDPPGPIKTLVIAEALVQLQQETAGYSRTVGSGERSQQGSGPTLQDMRNNVFAQYGRVRYGAI